MATTTTDKPKRRSKAEQRKLLAQLTDNGGTKTVQQLAKDEGVTENTVYAWKKKAGKRSGKRAAKKKRRAVSAAPPVSNGHTPPVATPTIELRGLRAWVDQAVAAELKRRFGS